MKNKGLTLVEVLVSVGIFLLISVSIYRGYVAIYNMVFASHAKITAANLINEQFEIVRNLEYADVGIVNSVPAGLLTHEQTLTRDNITFLVTTTVRNADDPFDGTIGGSPNDLSPADYKLVEVEVTCEVCKNFPGMKVTSRVSPKNLETASTNGALFIQVLDSNGQPVADAEVTVDNVTSSLEIQDVTNAQGMLQIVDVPPGVNAYSITVEKVGYTQDQTYLPGDAQNPNPLKPHATVSLQQVTQITFVIDEATTFNVSSITPTCSAVGGVDFNLAGSRLIGTGPDVKKYDVDHVTNGSGKKVISDIEWDTYELSLTDTGYQFMGMNPQNPFSVIAGATQDVDIILAPNDPNSLLVSVRDASTQLPVSGAEVTIEYASFEDSLITGQGFSTQTDWSGGSGQLVFEDQDKFDSSDGNIEFSDPPGELKLRNVLDTYFTDGSLESSVFDVGTTSNFHNIIWEPTSQPPDTGTDSVRFQIATNISSTSPWSFVGPDGTSGSYYTLSNSNISSIHNGDQYIRYKVFLSTASTTLTPNISDVSFTYTSDCIPPGQALFSGLGAGTYDITVSKSGYETFTAQTPILTSWQQLNVTLLPE